MKRADADQEALVAGLCLGGRWPMRGAGELHLSGLLCVLQSRAVDD
jgi:hypothetical protein